MSGFDRLAKPYRWLEYLSFGRNLERCRFHFLPQLAGTQRALLLGDGDGRFAERLLRNMLTHEALAAGAPTPDPMTNRAIQETVSTLPSLTQSVGVPRITAVDGSAAMLSLLRARCAFADSRLQTYVADLTKGLPSALQGSQFDVVSTHFFLDCLSTEEVNRLLADVRRCMTDGAVWVISEFAVPARGAMRLPAWLVVRGLYLGFRVLTGLRTRRLPDYREAMQTQGMVLKQESKMLGGLLTAQLWRCGAASNR
jgi:hypothetical protein